MQGWCNRVSHCMGAQGSIHADEACAWGGRALLCAMGCSIHLSSAIWVDTHQSIIILQNIIQVLVTVLGARLLSLSAQWLVTSLPKASVCAFTWDIPDKHGRNTLAWTVQSREGMHWFFFCYFQWPVPSLANRFWASLNYFSARWHVDLHMRSCDEGRVHRTYVGKMISNNSTVFL